MTHLMIDIETLGRRPDAIITQIGAVFFSPTGIPGAYGETFNTNVDIERQKGRTVSLETLKFWLGQPNEASEHMRLEDQPSLELALREFRTFITVNTQEEDKLFVWANGACFDFMILEHALEDCDIQVPWEYHQVNDLRTLRNLGYPKRSEEVYRTKVANGEGLTKHNAHDDCIQQIAMLQELLYDLQNNAFVE